MREIGTATYSAYDEDGFPLIQYDSHGESGQVGKISAFELHHTFGFAARPRDPEVDTEKEPIPGKGCALFVDDEGDMVHGTLGYDPRYIPRVPQMTKGSSCQYSATGSFFLLDGDDDDGTATLYVPVSSTKGHAITVGKDGNGEEYLGLVHCDGMAITMLDGGMVLKNANGSAYLELNSSGIVLSGNVNTVGGFSAGNVPLPLVTHAGLTAVITELKEQIVASFGSAVGAISAPIGLPLGSLAAAATLLTKGT